MNDYAMPSPWAARPGRGESRRGWKMKESQMRADEPRGEARRDRGEAHDHHDHSDHSDHHDRRREGRRGSPPPWRGAGPGGPGGWMGGGPGGFGGPGGSWPGRGGRGRGRAGRGDVRTAILLLLAEEPRNGYQLIQEIEQRSGGVWKPSSGSVYPALQLLEDEGLVITSQADGRRVFALTEAGQAHVAEHRDRLTAPWDAVVGPTDETIQGHELMSQLGLAFMQVVHVGTEAQRAEARKVLTNARQALYRILAAETPDDDA